MPVSGKLFYFRHGTQAPGHLPIILIHGAGGTHMHWPPQLRRLANWQIYAPDLPGHGKSAGEGRASIAAYAMDMVAFVSSVDFPSAVWIGHSMGSAIAMTIAIRYPERVKALVLIGSGAKLRVDSEILRTAGDRKNQERAVSLLIERLYGSNVDPQLRKLGTKQMLETGPGVLHGDLSACDHFDIRDQLSKLSQPTLILCGGDDRMTPVKFSEYLAANIPDSTIHIHRSGGHMIMLEQPVWVQHEIENFLQIFRNQGNATIREKV